ncbi:U11/U12 small nuclear ribonucleoprotein 35 kDa protein isoform X2 [Denticeps clupeoides]|nr:U11/U12 small nuclear ribonucleoprotein 35 kDa protein isoform X2 [Denticeps clupeoides]
MMSEWSPVAKVYDPLKAGSIDGTDVEPHDHAVWRAMQARYQPNKGVSGDPHLTLFVARLNLQTTEEKVHKVFSKYGDIRQLRLVRDIVTGFSKGYAFVEYKEERSVVRAQRDAFRLVVDQHELFVDFEQERTLKGWIPRRLGGGQGGKKESGQLRFGGRDRPFRKPISLATATTAQERTTERRWERSSERDDRHKERHRPSSPGRNHDRREARERWNDRADKDHYLEKRGSWPQRDRSTENRGRDEKRYRHKHS